MGVKERRQRERTQVREKILDAALEVFAKDGTDGVTMRALADAIEYSPPVIYAHFRDKDAIIRELCYRQLRDLAKTFATFADLDPIDSPLIVSPDDLAEVVQALARSKAEVAAVLDDPPTARISFENKNLLNNMSGEYAKALRKRYLKETAQIRTFLSAPENEDILRFYEAVVDEFQLKIIAKRKDHQSFDEVMEYLLDLLFARDPVLRQLRHKRLTRAVLFYMYWNCDIGEVADAAAD